MGRAPCCDKANVKKGPWSPEEDAKLKAYIEQHGTGGNWIALPQKVGLKRCGKSCRLRWLNYLRPNIKHGGFSEEEDNIICSLYVSIGSRWSIIAAQLPGRTDNDIKNYWNTRLKKKLLGKRKDQQSRRLAAVKHEAKDVKRYVNSEANTSTNAYRPQPGMEHMNMHMTMNMNAPYANLGPSAIVPQLFEPPATSAAATMTGSPNSEPSRLILNPHQGLEELSDNSCLRKLLQRLEGTLIDRSSNTITSQMQASTCIHASQMPHFANLDAATQVSYDTAAPPMLYARCMESMKVQPIASVALDNQNDNSLVFSSSNSMQTLRESCSSPEANYQSAWINGFNAENSNNNGYGFSMELNDLLYCNNSSLQLQREEANYACGVNGTDTSCWNTPQLMASDIPKSSSNTFPVFPNYILPISDIGQQGIFQEESIFEL
eukprot:Gb_29789 [translate_table: standard]